MISSPPRSTAIPSDDELSALVEATLVSGPCCSVVFLATVATLGSPLFGYNTGVITGALLYMYMPSAAGGLGLNESDESLVGVILAPGAALGVTLGRRISGPRGRCFNILFFAGVFTIAILGCTLSLNIPALLLFRFILDWAVDGASATVSIYLPESAPIRVRSQLVALDQFMIVFGQLFAYSMNAMLACGHGGPHVTIDPAIA